MRILVRAPNWIGDQVLAYPFFHYLRKTYPRAHIVSACVPWVQDIQFRNLVDDVVVIPRPNSDSLRDRFHAIEEGARRARKTGAWDLAIALPNSISAAWFLFRARAKVRRGYQSEGRSILLHEAIPRGERKHRSASYCGLLPDLTKVRFPAQEFWGIHPENHLDPKIPGEVEFFDAAKAWPDFPWLRPPREPFWVLAPGATADSRRWPSSYFSTLARTIAEQTGWQGVVVGGAKEAPMADELCRDRSLRLLDMTGKGRVPELALLFKEAKFTVTNESGLAHVAALCGSPTQIVCGAADPTRTRPIGPGMVRVAINPIACWPCEKNVCELEPPHQKISCLLGIKPEIVWEEIQRGLRRG